jgi:Leucine-rich repeat (LRR) protein
LEWIDLENNQIVDISAFSDLMNLRRIYLGDNQIVDISAFSDLMNLSYIELDNNQIEDLYPLIQNNEFGERQSWEPEDTIYLYNNPLNETSINIYIPELEARGVIVYYGTG